MARTVPISAQPLPGSEAAGTITIEVAAKLLMVTPEWIRRLSKDGWVAKTERGRYRVVDVVQVSLPKTPSAWVAALTESEHDPGR